MSSSTSQQKHALAQQVNKKENATLEQQIEILNWYYTNGKVQMKTAAHFNQIYPTLHLTQPRILDWLKKEAKWRTEFESSRGLSCLVKRVHQTQHPEVMEMLDLWVSKAMTDKLLLTGEVLCQKWRTFADLVGVPEDKRLALSEGWLSRYKAQNRLKQIKRHGDAASVALDTVNKEQLRVQELIKKHGYKPRDIFNADETALFYAYVFSIFSDYTHLKWT